MRNINLVVGSERRGHARTWAIHTVIAKFFPYSTYDITVSYGQRESYQSASFRTFRFGVQQKAGASPRVVGLMDQQTHTIKAWLPNYRVHSAASQEIGAWQVYDNFLIHDGPDYPSERPAYASIGCLEICGAPAGFDQFNDFIINASGITNGSRSEKLAQIGESGKMTITYMRATRPPLTKW